MQKAIDSFFSSEDQNNYISHYNGFKDNNNTLRTSELSKDSISISSMSNSIVHSYIRKKKERKNVPHLDSKYINSNSRFTELHASSMIENSNCSSKSGPKNTSIDYKKGSALFDSSELNKNKSMDYNNYPNTNDACSNNPALTIKNKKTNSRNRQKDLHEFRNFAESLNTQRTNVYFKKHNSNINEKILNINQETTNDDFITNFKLNHYDINKIYPLKDKFKLNETSKKFLIDKIKHLNK